MNGSIVKCGGIDVILGNANTLKGWERDRWGSH